MAKDYDFYDGYSEIFLGNPVALPLLDAYKDDLALDREANSATIPYVNYSLAMSRSRRFPVFTASNIDGLTFKKAPRKDNWRKDPRIDLDAQWGAEL
jgi:endonuclease G